MLAHRNPWILIAVCLVFSGLGGWTVSQAEAAPIFAIIDAGSSGSRLFLYRVEKDAQGYPKAESVPVIGLNKIKPGISTLVTTPEAAGPYIQPLLSSLEVTLKSLGVPQDQVFFSIMATAGMRVESPLQQAKVYAAVTQQAKASVPGMTIQYATTIQGRYEGAFEWLSVNYLQGHLGSGLSASTGVLETGGGSYQMTWETPPLKRQTLDVFSLDYGPSRYTLFSRSFTGLGGNYSREDATDDPNCFPKDYPLASGALGTGNYAKGLLLNRKMIRARDFRIPPTVKPPSLETMLGVGLFKGVAQDLKLGDRVSSVRVDAAARLIAATPWSVLVAGAPNNPFLFSQVDAAQLVSEILRTWFSERQELPVADTLNGKEISWTLGAALFLSSGNILPTP